MAISKVIWHCVLPSFLIPVRLLTRYLSQDTNSTTYKRTDTRSREAMGELTRLLQREQEDEETVE
ncbi:uncharacterized protein RAG0_17224 [Rhynchosporium agropyri]|uniref:Uncharacterized protein n=1 Tax=Rhynchosporium agropyri TaxID=914238 RepID=A0A1E1LTB6_9HELO|nr:uncharacterized protein RAG0_17224 [Rhynchosporium agropyri]